MRRASTVRMGVLALLWGSSFLWIKVALNGLSPMQMVLVRLVLGASVLLVFVRASRLALPRDRRIWRRLLVAATFGNVLPFTLFAVGERTVDSAVAGVLNGTTPLFAMVIGLAVRAEPRLPAQRAAGLGLGFGGTLLIFEPWQSGTSIMSWGGLACLAAGCSYGVSFVYMSSRLANRGIPPLALSASQLLVAAALAAALVPFVGLQPVHLRPDVIGSVAMLGVFSTGIAFVLNYRVITDEGGTTASTVAYLLPVVAVLLGAAILGEPLTAHVVLGMLLVLVGVWLAQRARAPRPAARAGSDGATASRSDRQRAG